MISSINSNSQKVIVLTHQHGFFGKEACVVHLGCECRRHSGVMVRVRIAYIPQFIINSIPSSVCCILSSIAVSAVSTKYLSRTRSVIYQSSGYRGCGV